MQVASPVLRRPSLVVRDNVSQDTGIIMFAYGAHVMRLCDFASLAWVIYDWLYTLEDEVKLIWGSANTPPKFLYFFCRYIGLCTVIVVASGVFGFYCFNRLIFVSVMYHLLNYGIEISLVIRVYALWGQGKRVAVNLLLIFAITEVVNLTVLVRGMHALKPITYSVPTSWPVQGCVDLYFPSIWHYNWLPILFFETLMFVISCIRCLSYRPFSNAPLVARIFRDSAIYYVCLLLYYLIETIQVSTGNKLSYIDAFTPAFVSLASSHLLLSIRAYVREESTLISPSAIKFKVSGGETTALETQEVFISPSRSLPATATSTLPMISIHAVISEARRDEEDAIDGDGGPVPPYHTQLEESSDFPSPEAHAAPVHSVISLRSPLAEDEAILSGGEHTSTTRRFGERFTDWIVTE